MKSVVFDIAHIFRGAPDTQGKATAQTFLLATHVQPDGDAMGSIMALGHVISHFGGDVRIYLSGGIPQNFAWLACPWPVVTSLAELGDWLPQVVATVDCGDVARTGAELMAWFTQPSVIEGWEHVISINIDHHHGNPEFAHLNWVEDTWPATGMMIGALAEHLQLPLEGDFGKALYLSIVSDTGGFSFGNTSAEALAFASRIVKAGLQVAEFTVQSENNWSINRMHLWGEMMHNVTLHHEGKVACCMVTLQMLADYEAAKSDMEGFAAYLRRIKGVQVGLFIREDAPNHSKVSLRSMGFVDVQRVARALGGGGHISAAGAEVAMSPEAAREQVLELLKN